MMGIFEVFSLFAIKEIFTQEFLCNSPCAHVQKFILDMFRKRVARL